MPIGPVEQEIQDAYVRLAESAAMVRYHHEHYLDGLAFSAVTALTGAHPWALAGFGAPAWDA
ncbi:MAG: hypothetical protein JO285_11965, partial [Kutzneria sp.]|nr:hypothetical protein [Kutzneria sp.]